MAIIRSFGLFWSAEDVYWGRGSQKGTLLGLPAQAKSSEPIDFRSQIGIYVLYQDHTMIYVGQTGSKNQRLLGRLKRHRKDYLAGRWNRFSWFGLRGALASGRLSTKVARASASLDSALNHIEAVLIAAAEPAQNKQGGRFGKTVTRYIQYRDSRLGLTDRQKLDEMWEILKWDG